MTTKAETPKERRARREREEYERKLARNRAEEEARAARDAEETAAAAMVASSISGPLDVGTAEETTKLPTAPVEPNAQPSSGGGGWSDATPVGAATAGDPPVASFVRKPTGG